MNNELYHHGIKGMHWGIRRYQNKDGTYTSAGKQKRASESSDSQSSKKGLSDRKKKALKVGVAAVATGLVVYGGYKVNQHIKVNSQAKETVEKAFAKYKAEKVDSLLESREGARDFWKGLGNNLDESYNYSKERISQDLTKGAQNTIKKSTKELSGKIKERNRKDRKQTIKRAIDRYEAAFPRLKYPDPRENYRYRENYEDIPDYMRRWEGHGRKKRN